ncbi:MAG: tetratricopeptide repeat protein [Bacteroidales bacterium]|nr:tetratricopeptide repeat protein [Bacteroidales bacterium]
MSRKPYTYRTMKRIAPYVLFLSLLLPVCSHAADSRFSDGVSAYEQGDYEAALQAWLDLQAEGWESGHLYYNIGNAYFRQDDMAHAILYYERALRLMPNDSDLRENLELARSKTEDRIEAVPTFVLAAWWQRLVSLWSVQGWMVVCIVLVALLTTAVVVVTTGTRFAWRKWSLLLGDVWLLLLLVAVGATTAAHARLTADNEAVVMQTAVVKSSPDRGGVDKFILHEGTKVHIDEQSGLWCKVHLADGNSGWMEAADAEQI